MISPSMQKYIRDKVPEEQRPAVLAWCGLFDDQCRDRAPAEVVVWLLHALERLKLQLQVVQEEGDDPGLVRLRERSQDEAIATLPVLAAYLHKASEVLAGFALSGEDEVTP